MSSNNTRKYLIQIVQKNGWVQTKSRGGHLQFIHPIYRGKVTIPHKITKNIEISVLKQAHIDKNERGFVR